MSEYIRTNKFDTNECPNIFVKEKLIRMNVRIYIRDQYIRIFEYIRHTLIYNTHYNLAPFSHTFNVQNIWFGKCSESLRASAKPNLNSTNERADNIQPMRKEIKIQCPDPFYSELLHI